MVRGMRGVGGVCEMCMCLARGGVGGEVDERIGLYQSRGSRGSVGCVCVLVAVGRGLGPVCIVLGGYLHIRRAPYGYLHPNMYLFISDIANPD